MSWAGPRSNQAERRTKFLSHCDPPCVIRGARLTEAGATRLAERGLR
jgi:hypothetical protein